MATKVSVNQGAGSKRKFIEIREQIRARIRAGELKVGQRIPAERVLAQQIGVAHMTVRHALNQLTQEGWLRRKRGSGTYVAANLPRQNMELVVLHHGLDGLPGMVFRRVQAALRGSQRGFSVTVLMEFRDSAEEFYRRVLHPKLVGGVLLLGFNDQDRSFVSRLSSQVPTVLLNKPLTGLSLDVVMSDREPALAAVFEHFLATGRRRLACLCDDPGHALLRENLNSVEHLSRSLGLPMPDSLRLVRPRLSFDELEESLAGGDPPDAIVAFNHHLARRAMVCLQDRGLLLGRDYELTAAMSYLEDVRDIGVRFPVIVDHEAIVAEALERLSQLMSSAERLEPRVLRLPASVVWPARIPRGKAQPAGPA
jgi:DNA-binding LacI/PurR family transcriptional regulator